MLVLQACIRSLATENSSPMWLTSLTLKEMGFNLNPGLSLRYNCPIADIPSTCLCGEPFTIDHAMICMRGGLEFLNKVCKDVATEPDSISRC